MSKHTGPGSRAFRLFQQEGHLMASALASGLTAARKAHDQEKGSVYVALFNLSIGLERLFKAVVIAEHMALHELRAPTKKRLQDYGHDLKGLYDACVVIGTRRGHALTPRFELDALDEGIVDLLSDFGKGARYHNLDQLGGAHASDDPLARWAGLLGLASDDVSEGTKTRIRTGAAATASLMADLTMVILTGLDGNRCRWKKPSCDHTSMALQLPIWCGAWSGSSTRSSLFSTRPVRPSTKRQTRQSCPWPCSSSLNGCGQTGLMCSGKRGGRELVSPRPV